jgi:integrase/recombinase XerD
VTGKAGEQAVGMPSSRFRGLARDYVAFRRRLGFDLDRTVPLVNRFAEYCDARDMAYVTVEAVLDWVLLAQPVAASYRWLRLNAARGFATYLHVLDPSHEIPPSDLVPYGHNRPTPCIMTTDMIDTLMDVAGRQRPRLHAATFRTLIGLMAVSGMRPCEAVRADNRDIDPTEGAMTLHGKKGRERRIALHPSTLDALTDYQRVRDRLIPGYAGPSLLVNIRGHRLDAGDAGTHFAHLVDQAGLGDLTPRPTLRALRHSFAVTTLTGWLNEDADTRICFPLLSAQLGHTKPRHTYWYLQAVPELLQAASDHMLRASAGTPTQDQP